jgi:predicted O-methyltransferase YrrM
MGKTQKLSTAWLGEKSISDSDAALRLPVGAARRSCQQHQINARAGLKLSECLLSNQRKMLVFQLPQRRQLKQTVQTSSLSTSYYSMWDAVTRFAKEVRTSEFMSDMIDRRDAYGSEGVMGAVDCATLYGLTRWLRPIVLVESGGFVGMSSAFILRALADEQLATSKLYSIELSEDCDQGALIPDDLRSSPRFVPMRGRIEDFLKNDQLPRSIDMFLHDSSHSYQHMLWEFRQFWPRLRDGGLLVSHDVQMNAAFPEFVTKTYAHEKKTGRRDMQRTTHHEWGRWGYLGFAIKKDSR